MCSDECPCSPAMKVVYSASLPRYDGYLTSFKQCSQQLQASGVLSSEPFSESQLSMVTTLETTYQCSGLCKPALVWTTLDMSLRGPPQQGCSEPLKELFDKTIGALSVSLLVTACIYLLAFFSSCGLWRTRNQRTSAPPTRGVVEADLTELDAPPLESPKVKKAKKEVKEDLGSEDF